MSDEKTQTFNLTLTQISAGAFAATAAAVIGSELGVAGTVVGAALGSVTTSVAAALYQHSVERSRVAARALAKAERRGARPAPDPDGEEPVAGTADPADPASAVDTAGATAGTAGTAATAGTDGTADAAGTAGTGGRRRMAVAVAVLAAFVLSLVAITGMEALRGEPLSGGGGTTIGRVLDGAAPLPEPAPSGTPSTPPPTPSSTTTVPASTTTEAPPTTIIPPTTSGAPPSATTSNPAPTTISDQGPTTVP